MSRKSSSARGQTLWRSYSARFLALSRRERLMAATAVLCLITYLAITLWLGPAFERTRQYDQQNAARAEELASLESQIKTLAGQLASDPAAPLQRELEVLEKQMAEAEERLQPYGSAMVEPTQTVTLLKDLIRQTPGVHLAGFNNLPAIGLLASQEPAPKKGETARVFGNDVYKHGFEIRLRGNYLALLAYLRTLEAQPERLFWQRAKLEVGTYPESELTLTVYTLSLDRHWLEL